MLLGGSKSRNSTILFVIHLWVTFFIKCNFYAGFDDQDMERPSFSEPAEHASVPLLLSKPGVNPVIQVRIMLVCQQIDTKWVQQSFVFSNYPPPSRLHSTKIRTLITCISAVQFLPFHPPPNYIRPWD